MCPGGARSRRSRRSKTRRRLSAEFELVREAIAYLRAGSELGFGSLADPAAWLARLVVPGSVLTIAELLDAVSLMETVGGVRQTLRGEAAKISAPRANAPPRLPIFAHLSAAIRRAILPNGEISDDASPQLQAHSRGNRAGARENPAVARRHPARARRAGETGEDYITLRNDRFVIPVRASERRSVPGVVHGASATGQTVFVEPLEAIDLNNRLVQLGDEEVAEIARILEELTERVRAERGPLDAAAADHRASRFDFRASAFRARIRLRDAGIHGWAIRCAWKRRAIRCSKRRCGRRDAKWCR